MTERSAVLVVDDEAPLAVALVRKFKASDLDAESAHDAPTALARLEARAFQVVLMDVSMPGMSGIDALARIREKHPDIEVVMMTGQASVGLAVEAMRRGAFEFLQKPFESLDHVVLVLRRALERQNLRAQNVALRTRLERQTPSLIGNSPAIRAILATVPDLARSDAPVLIEGESGTGKEVLARSIHAGGARASKPFVAVNCGAIPEAMLESELFGHEKGAFTGAVTATRGLFRAADGGTLFLDEIGELPAQMQVKLLRALQEGEVRAVGSTVTQRVDVRVIAATNRNLKDRIGQGRFRQDLYYRLAVVPMKLTPLRERREDVPLLVRHFLDVFNAEGQKFDEVDPKAMDCLTAWDWPGNVRELENAIARAFALGKAGCLGLDHLPPDLVGGEGGVRGIRAADLDALPLSLDAFEKYALERALREADGDATRAAELLAVPRSTFYRRLQRHKIKAEK